MVPSILARKVLFQNLEQPIYCSLLLGLTVTLATLQFFNRHYSLKVGNEDRKLLSFPGLDSQVP